MARLAPSRDGFGGTPLDAFLPMTPDEMAARGWSELDILIVTGDAYVDHPSFGAALVGRSLEARGYRVGVVAQPDWLRLDDVTRLGRPRLMAGVTAGNLDSMLNRFTAQNKPRSEDRYSPGGRTALRPKRATIVYANLLRRAFPGLPIVLGGIEASLRRLAHYDYWSGRVRRSVLCDAQGDLLLFGMAERALGEVAQRLAAGEPIGRIRGVAGSGYRLGPSAAAELEPSRRPGDGGVLRLPSFEQVSDDPRAFCRMTMAIERESNPRCGRALLQPHGQSAVYLCPPALPLEQPELDALYALPFVGAPHWSYRERISAFETVKHSLASCRGCFGGCAFCSIAAHEGRAVRSRSAQSLLDEASRLTAQADFHGTISDVGGPTANMYGMGCAAPEIERICRRSSCIYPSVCQHLDAGAGPFIELLAALRALPGVRHAYVASGIRYDLALRSQQLMAELAAHHTGGQLSVAPEHSSPQVLAYMRKPAINVYQRFVGEFQRASRATGKDQHLVPYFISGHPGTRLEDMIELACYLKRHGIRPRQVQDFIPTPMSLATAMYFTGLDPRTLEPVAVARAARDKRLQKALLLYWDPAHHDEVRTALRLAGRRDLIGSSTRALVPPARGQGALPRSRQADHSNRRRPNQSSRRRAKKK